MRKSLFFFFHILPAILSIKINLGEDVSSNRPQTIMSLSQYHFLPVGTYFQYSLTTSEEGFDNRFLNKSIL
jgi:hypothetical protein